MTPLEQQLRKRVEEMAETDRRSPLIAGTLHEKCAYLRGAHSLLPLVLELSAALEKYEPILRKFGCSYVSDHDDPYPFLEGMKFSTSYSIPNYEYLSLEEHQALVKEAEEAIYDFLLGKMVRLGFTWSDMATHTLKKLILEWRKAK